MVTDVETRAANVRGEKVARACDSCTRRLHASWYCPADDAFLCHSCDASVHLANELAKRHVRVQLQSEKAKSVWYEGFKRKARTPRNKGSNDPLVPELGVGEEEEDVFFLFSSSDEKEENLNCCVPVFDHSSLDMVIDDGVTITTNRGDDLGEIEKAIMDDEGLVGLLPLDMDLGDLPMDMERLLEGDEELFLGVKEFDDIGVETDETVGFERNCTALKRVKHEEEGGEIKCENGGSTRERDGEECEDGQDRKMNLFLRLDYEAVIASWDSHGSPWISGIKPEFYRVDYWQECALEGNKCQSHDSRVKDWFKDKNVQGRGGGVLDGKREARVLRYKEKRRTRLFMKKIRYEVRKINAEQRPRIKGRFVKRTSLLM